MENRFRNFFLGRGDFKSKNEIIDAVYNSSQFDSSKESKHSSEALLIFQTSKQQTWLVSTSERLYCVLDDIDKGLTKVQWFIPSGDLISDNKVIANISVKNKSHNTGLLSINDHKNWLFSKRLFTMYEIESSIHDLISRTMKNVTASQQY